MFNLPCDEGESMLRELEEDTRVDSRMYARTAGDSFQILFSKPLVTPMEQGGNRLLETMKGLHWQGGMFHLPLTQSFCQRKLYIPVQVSLLPENPLLPHWSEPDDKRSSGKKVEQLLQDWLQGVTSDSEWLQNCSDGLGSWERKLFDKIFSCRLGFWTPTYSVILISCTFRHFKVSATQTLKELDALSTFKESSAEDTELALCEAFLCMVVFG